MELKKVIEADFADNLVSQATVKATNERKPFSVANAIDNNKNTYWATEDGVTNASLEFTFSKPTTFNRFLAQEYITLGQRVKKFKIEYEKDGQWQPIDAQTTIGYKRILRFEPVTATKLRFTILDAKAAPLISNIGVYNAPQLLVTPIVTRTKEGYINMKAADKATEIYFTLDGSTPTEKSMRYGSPFALAKPTTLKVVAFDRSRNQYSEVASHPIEVAKGLWKVIATSAKEVKTIDRIIDDSATTWGYQKKENDTPAITIDLGETLSLSGFTYLPSQDRWAEGTISHYVFEVSTDNVHWKKVSEGEFGNIKNNPIEQRISFATKENARYIRLIATKTVDNSSIVSYGEIGVITQ